MVIVIPDIFADTNDRADMQYYTQRSEFRIWESKINNAYWKIIILSALSSDTEQKHK